MDDYEERYDRLCRELSELDDKRDAAIHEAGHVVVAARRDGIALSAHIERREPMTPMQRVWHGRTKGFSWAEGGISSAASVAGAAAVLLVEQPDVDAEGCMSAVLSEWVELSDTDKRGLPSTRDGQLRAFADALNTLRDNREFFDWIVAKLMDDGCGNAVTGAIVVEYLRSRKP